MVCFEHVEIVIPGFRDTDFLELHPEEFPISLQYPVQTKAGSDRYACASVLLILFILFFFFLVVD